MLVGANTFVVCVLIGLFVGAANASIKYYDTRSGWGSIRTFVGWLIAFTITGFIATPIAQWFLHNVL